ncbi:MAG: hypothetical protein ACI8W8_000633 [Rhodothermales bacterium]
MDDANGAAASEVLTGKTYWSLKSGGAWGLQTGTATIGGGPPRAIVGKTGQTTSYATGDDGDLEPGLAPPSPRFTDNGDGTVTDNLTNLIWLKDVRASSNIFTWDSCVIFSNNLANGEQGLSDGSSAGDWRFPTVKEMRSLIDLGNASPSLPSGHPFTNVGSTTRYWSSTTYAANTTSSAWDVSVGEGRVRAISKTNARPVWPVRGGESRFTDNGDGTVTDNLTNLIWLKDADAGDGPETWANALSICNNLANVQQGLSDGSSAGDWRLPTEKELHSLIDLGNFSPALPSGHPFTGAQSSKYWSSTTRRASTTSAWDVDLADGQVHGNTLKTTAFYVWPVRGG